MPLAYDHLMLLMNRLAVASIALVFPGACAGSETPATSPGAGGRGGDASPGEAATADTGTPGAHPLMTFFLTSTGSGAMGGNLGGLGAADAKCKQLATAVGAGGKQWVAWLSVEMGPGGQPVHARNRVGTGPWHDSRGRLIAMNLADLLPGPDLRPRGDPEAVNDLADENGFAFPRSPVLHDILTGTLASGMLAPGQTCGDWKSTTGTAQLGHSDNRGPFSWTEAHTSVGCNAAGVSAGGGDGRFYCFARQ
jgi:hypothetical protein